MAIALISNKLAENSISLFTIGRKTGSLVAVRKGAASAAVYSIIETAKANGLDPYKYLLFSEKCRVSCLGSIRNSLRIIFHGAQKYSKRASRAKT
jgi:hypothetical protein